MLTQKMETGFYDAAGSWQRITAPASFGRNFGGWGTRELLIKRLKRERRAAIDHAA